MTQTHDAEWLFNELKKAAQQPETAYLEEHHFTEPEPIHCKWCGSVDVMKYGSRKGVQEYICQKCGRKFIAKDTPFKSQTPAEQIGAALAMFYDGLSFAEIARRMSEDYGNPVAESTVYRWVINYTMKAVNELEKLKPKVSDTWVVDETVIKVAGDNLWFWDVIDEGTRFLLASHLSKARTIQDVVFFMRKAWERAGKAPRWILSDGMVAYPDGIEKVFGAEAKHIQAKGISHEINTNLIEGFLAHYNFFRPHMTLNDRTPADVAGIRLPYKTWTEYIRHAGGIHLDA
jgi:putative transposase